MSESKIISWNVRGVNTSAPELNLLLRKENPDVVCLQETKLSADRQDFAIRGYKAHHRINTDGQIACGGVSVFVKDRTPHRKVELRSNLQAVAVRVTLEKVITVCSIYIPPSDRNDETHLERELEELFEELPLPWVVTGDFNAQSPIWDDSNPTPNHKGKAVEKILEKRQDVCIVNSQEATHFDLGSQTTSAIDLTLTNASLISNLTWSVMDDLYGSDHYPIVLSVSTTGRRQTFPEKWNPKRADWEAFSNLCLQNIPADLKDYGEFVKKLTDVCNSTIPKTSRKPRKNVPWFNEECRVALKEKKKAHRKLRRQPSEQNKILFKMARAKARRTLRECKRRSFREFVSGLGSQTPITKVWKSIRSLKGLESSSSVTHIRKPDGSSAESEKEIANEIAERLSQNSSSAHYTQNFQRHKNDAEKTRLNFTSNNKENYNIAFTLEELESSLSDTGNTSPGPDGISYNILRHLPRETLGVLLNVFNNIWTTQAFPDSWRLATVVPIPKPGKDHSDASNYRPISLTSCLCKLMEKMVNRRLVWYLETNNSLSNLQCGFRKNRTTVDHLVRLESLIREVLVNKGHLVAIFFDLEKAFDTTWKYGILKDLHSLGLRGHLPMFVKEFLKNRSFQTKVGSTLSEPRNQEEGVPQGSILSPILFEIKINSIAETLKNNVDGSLYVDDFLICYKSYSKGLDVIERQLQTQLDTLREWADQNGFSFSPAKTVAVHFCNRTTCLLEPELYMDRDRQHQIQVSNQARFLGLIFDKKLNFKPHIEDLRQRCMKAMRVVKVLSSSVWGADTNLLLHIYRTLVRSKLDYASFVYGSARKSYIKKLDPIHNLGIRLALGSFRTSSVGANQVEADEPSLEHRRQKLALQYTTKLATNTQNPAHNTVFHIAQKTKTTFDKNKNFIPPLGIRITKPMEDSKIETKSLIKNSKPKTPPWLLHRPKVDTELTKFHKNSTDQHPFRQIFKEKLEQYKEYKHIYTDGSKDNDAVGCAFSSEERNGSRRLDDSASIFTAESTAIDMALDSVEKSSAQKFLILSDSLSCLKSLSRFENPDPRVRLLSEKIHTLSSDRKEIAFLWIPSHIGIQGNEKVDKLAKDALRLPRRRPRAIWQPDVKPQIRGLVRSLQKDDWAQDTKGRHCHEIKPNPGPRRPARFCRREEVMLTRLRIGHTRLTHSHLLSTTIEAPICGDCDCVLTLQHIFFECPSLNRSRGDHIRCDNFRELLSSGQHDRDVIAFLKATPFYERI